MDETQGTGVSEPTPNEDSPVQAFTQALEEAERAMQNFENTAVRCNLTSLTLEEVEALERRLEALNPSRAKLHVRCTVLLARQLRRERADFERYGYFFPEKDVLTPYEVGLVKEYERSIVHTVYEGFLIVW